MSTDDPLNDLNDTEKRALIELAKERASEYVNRRSVLGALGSGAGMVAAGTVGFNEGVQQAQAAASTSDGDGDMGTPSKRVDVFADGVDAVSVGADTLSSTLDNKVRQVDTGESIQTALDAVANADDRRSGVVALRGAGESGDYYSLSADTLPITVPAGVTLDLNGAWINYTSAFDTMFELKPSAKVVAPGRIRTTNGNAGATIFLVNDVDAHSSRDNTAILGYPRIQTSGAAGVHFLQNNGNSISGCRAELCAWNSDTIARFENAATGGWVNQNHVEATGTIQTGNAFEFVHTAGTEETLNVVTTHALNILANVDRVALFDGGGVNHNVVRGTMFDVANTTTPWEWTSGTGGYNKVVRRWHTVAAGTNNSGDATNEAVADMTL